VCVSAVLRASQHSQPSHISITIYLFQIPLSPLILQVTTKGKNGGENYLYDQVAMDAFMKTLPENANPSIQRFKGLGEGCERLSCSFSLVGGMLCTALLLNITVELNRDALK
jgi:hypothetical protein